MVVAFAKIDKTLCIQENSTFISWYNIIAMQYFSNKDMLLLGKSKQKSTKLPGQDIFVV